MCIFICLLSFVIVTTDLAKVSEEGSLMSHVFVVLSDAVPAT